VRQRERPGWRRLSKLPRVLASMAVIAATALGATAWTQPAQPPHAQPAQPPHAQPAHAGAARHHTVVTLTFDDGTADQMAAAPIMRAQGMAGTFFIITGAIGTPHYLTRADLRQLAAAGNEIGGHTVNHLDLVNAHPTETRRQICAGRDILARWGFSVTSFAYPDGAYNHAVERIARACGYSAARIAGGLASGNCPGCRAAEGIPPADPYAIRTPGQVDTSWTLADLKKIVIQSERSGGGWLPVIIHHVCTGPGCGPLSISRSEFRAFVRWLAARASHGTVVETMRQALGSHLRPLHHAWPAPRHDVVNSSLESAGPSAQTSEDETPDRSGAPVCWMEGQYGANTARWQRVRDARTGHWALRLTMSGYRNGGAELVQLFDLGGCSLPVTAGKSYQLSAWYQSTAHTQFAVYYRDAAGRWHYWTSSPYFAPASRWAHAVWQTPPIPGGASGLSYGLSLFSNGTLTTDGYSFTAAPPGIARVVVTGVLAAMMALACAWALAARLTRSRGPRGDPGPRDGRGQEPRDGSLDRSQAAGTAPRKTRPPVANGRRAS
jgi:peptidoglycan/xylan/chitin deacetylase (PgdA/CDA1 family)